MEAAADVLRKAKSKDTDALIKAAEGLTFSTPFGPATLRAIDHQATLGAFVGKTAVQNDHGVMVDFTYVDGAKVLPSDAEVKALRPAN